MSGSSTLSRLSLRGLALGYLGILLVAPVALIFIKVWDDGFSVPFDAITSPNGLHAIYLSLLTVAIAVPLNTAFGVGCALLLVRRDFRGKGLINAVIDLPFALSPIVIGLSLYLVFAKTGWFGTWLIDHGFDVLFATPGIVFACIFVSLPFVVREVMPVLREIGTEQEEAATTLGANSWQTFWRVTLPSIRWGLGYGVVLTTARVLGEFGAVTIVSGSIAGKTETLPIWIQGQFEQFNNPGAYMGAIVLALFAFAALFLMQLVGGRADKTGASTTIGTEAIEPKEAV
jgi:sulfate/thiosulfate transport system permease protein